MKESQHNSENQIVCHLPYSVPLICNVIHYILDEECVWSSKIIWRVVISSLISPFTVSYVGLFESISLPSMQLGGSGKYGVNCVRPKQKICSFPITC